MHTCVSFLIQVYSLAATTNRKLAACSLVNLHPPRAASCPPCPRHALGAAAGDLNLSARAARTSVFVRALGCVIRCSCRRGRPLLPYLRAACANSELAGLQLPGLAAEAIEANLQLVGSGGQASSAACRLGVRRHQRRRWRQRRRPSRQPSFLHQHGSPGRQLAWLSTWPTGRG